MKKYSSLAIICLCSILIIACSTNKGKNERKADEESVLSILYQQQAGEYRALCLQAYALARRNVDEGLLYKKPHKPFAIITDLDETALDNSAAEAWLYKHDSTATIVFLRSWWVKGIAGAVPGSIEFFKYAKSKGVDIYYISNRDSTDSVITATRKNMQRLGFPYTSDTDTKHFLFLSAKAKTSSKESRRVQVAKTDSVLVLLGDNLIDLDHAFDQKGVTERDNEVDSLKNKWGGRYIVFPNAIYGDWEGAFYYDFKKQNPKITLTQHLKDSIRGTLLHSY
jgi:5'-nucleotidase (lipoprotein e(P4) family)